MKIDKLLFGVLLLLFASCGSSRKVEKPSGQSAVQEIKLAPEQQRKYDYFFLEASRLKVKRSIRPPSICYNIVWLLIQPVRQLYTRFPSIIFFLNKCRRGRKHWRRR